MEPGDLLGRLAGCLWFGPFGKGECEEIHKKSMDSEVPRKRGHLLAPVSYTHRRWPTICSVWFAMRGISLKKKIR